MMLQLGHDTISELDRGILGIQAKCQTMLQGTDAVGRVYIESRDSGHR